LFFFGCRFHAVILALSIRKRHVVFADPFAEFTNAMLIVECGRFDDSDRTAYRDNSFLKTETPGDVKRREFDNTALGGVSVDGGEGRAAFEVGSRALGAPPTTSATPAPVD
jgi:hypothetical protein